MINFVYIFFETPGILFIFRVKLLWGNTHQPQPHCPRKSHAKYELNTSKDLFEESLMYHCSCHGCNFHFWSVLFPLSIRSSKLMKFFIPSLIFSIFSRKCSTERKFGMQTLQCERMSKNGGNCWFGC